MNYFNKHGRGGEGREREREEEKEGGRAEWKKGGTNKDCS